MAIFLAILPPFLVGYGKQIICHDYKHGWTNEKHVHLRFTIFETLSQRYLPNIYIFNKTYWKHVVIFNCLRTPRQNLEIISVFVSIQRVRLFGKFQGLNIAIWHPFSFLLEAVKINQSLIFWKVSIFWYFCYCWHNRNMCYA